MMTAALDALYALPDLAQVVLFALIGGGVGIGLAELGRRGSVNRAGQLMLIVAPLVGFPAAFSGILGRHGAGVTAAQSMRTLMEHDLSRAALESDAATAQAFRQKLAQAALTMRKQEALDDHARQLAAELTTERFNALAPDASDEAILDYQKLALGVLEVIRNDPARCVQFIDGKAGFDAHDLPPGLQSDIGALKARIIMEGARRVAPFRTPLLSDDLRQSLSIGYRMTGRDIASLAKLNDTGAPAPARCVAALDYMTAVSSLEARRAAKVFKTLLLSRSGAP